MPYSALYGDRDMFIDDLENIRKAIPRCRTKLIKDTGTLICLEKPEDFSEAAIEFFKNPGV